MEGSLTGHIPEQRFLELGRAIGEIECNAALNADDGFSLRIEAIERLDREIIEQIRYLLSDRDAAPGLPELHRRAVMLRERLKDANERLFSSLRQDVYRRTLWGHVLQLELERYLPQRLSGRARFGPIYGALDELVDGILGVTVVPLSTRQLEPEMVYLQPTPVRLVLEMIKRAAICQDDVLFDVGSGLGQVAILVALLTGARAVGIEIEPAYCGCAQESARRVNAERVEFLNMDARQADCTAATVYYLYTPFQGRILTQFLDIMHAQAEKHPIRVCTYGPCTADVAGERWLRKLDKRPICDSELAVFVSR